MLITVNFILLQVLRTSIDIIPLLSVLHYLICLYFSQLVNSSNMGSVTAVVFNIILALQVTSAAFIPSIRQISGRSVVLQPTEDPFYVPPQNYESQQPGTILRARTVDLAFASTVPFNPKSVYQLLFRSTDSLGIASTAVSTIIIPQNANTTRLLSYQTAEDAS